ncbi:MAG TPA: hypothetical protein VMW27_23075 [Thermoanaerobaculia bacterium]|nr:hypothetical protein [Thermoanaerobaculia bacterium]
MPTQSGSVSRPPVDLTQVTESTRRALYEATVATYFSPTPEEVRQAAEDPENHWVPDYSPDDAGLAVVWALGRWFAAWRCLEESEDAPAELQWSIVRIVADADGGRDSLTFLEV